MSNYYFKVLNKNRMPCNGGSGQWPPPGEWAPAVPVDPCVSGYHMLRPRDLLEWLGPTIWLAEGKGYHRICKHKVVFEQARLIRQLPWNERTARLWACDCAERILHFYETDNPGDNRPRKAIEVARRYANGKAGKIELSAAREAAAWGAAWEAAREAAREAERRWQMRLLMEVYLGVQLAEGEE